MQLLLSNPVVNPSKTNHLPLRFSQLNITYYALFLFFFGFAYLVFLSFHGKDTRSNFTSHLYFALVQADFRTFRDDPALEKGQEISSAILHAIKHSKIFIVVVSENYARSPWCLNELVQILSCKRTEILVVPVFYYVDPSDVRYQKNSFGEALNGHKKRFSVDMIQKWKSALSEIAEISGHHLRKEANENESNTIHEIVGNVETWTSLTTVSHLEKSLSEINSAVEEIYQELDLESKIDVLEKSLSEISSAVEEKYEELDMESKIDVLEKSLSEINSGFKEKYQELNMESKIDVLEKSIVCIIDVPEKSLLWIGSAVEEIMESDSDDDFFSFF